MQYVYFVEGCGRIKIGTTRDVHGRFRDLDVACPVDLTLIGFIPGSHQLEMYLHRLLDAHRAKGEWFIDCAEVRALIAEALAGNVEQLAERAKAAKRKPDPNVTWASEALRKIATPVTRSDTTNTIVDRVSKRIGSTYWRTFDIWYAKARRLEIAEKERITAALQAVEQAA